MNHESFLRNIFTIILEEYFYYSKNIPFTKCRNGILNGNIRHIYSSSNHHE